MSKKKEMRARKKLIDTPWWKVKDNWFYVGILVFLFVIVGLAAIV